MNPDPKSDRARPCCDGDQEEDVVRLHLLLRRVGLLHPGHQADPDLALVEEPRRRLVVTGVTTADAIASVLIAMLILPRTWGLLRDAVDALLEATPKGFDMGLVRAHIPVNALLLKRTKLEGIRRYGAA